MMVFFSSLSSRSIAVCFPPSLLHKGQAPPTLSTNTSSMSGLSPSAPGCKDSDEEPTSNPNAGLSSPSNIQALNIQELPAEAMGQVADQTAWRLCVSPEGIHELTEYLEMPTPYQSVWLPASLICLSDQIKALIPRACSSCPFCPEGKNRPVCIFNTRRSGSKHICHGKPYLDHFIFF
ncbi:hypothetical protein B0H10DRAFT_2094348 [Mycena sp. CBHHK59/15]|nr:hypothetical protein B0H10DRAFT_2094348 [Mycena sp. CBHHK59/15]